MHYRSLCSGGYLSLFVNFQIEIVLYADNGLEIENIYQ